MNRAFISGMATERTALAFCLLLLMIGAFLGWKGALFSVVAGSLQGLVFAAFALVTGRKLTPAIDERVIDGEVIEAPEEPDSSRVGQLKLPFGPFLALGAIEYYFFGQTLLDLYTEFVSRLILGLF